MHNKAKRKTAKRKANDEVVDVGELRQRNDVHEFVRREINWPLAVVIIAALIVLVAYLTGNVEWLFMLLDKGLDRLEVLRP